MKWIYKSCLSHKQNIAGSTPVSATKTIIRRGGVVGRSRGSEKPEALLSIELSPQVVFTEIVQWLVQASHTRRIAVRFCFSVQERIFAACMKRGYMKLARTLW